VKRGTIGKIHIEVSWRKLASKPIVVTVEDVFIIVGPKEQIEVDEEELKQKLIAEKKENLTSWELVKFPDESVEQSKRGSASSTAEKIADNIQVTIKNFHLRYEFDPLTDKLPIFRQHKNPFSFGVSFRELSGHSTNAAWERMDEFPKKPEKVFRLFSLVDLSMYLNLEPDQTDTEILLRDACRAKPKLKWSYILPPLRADLKITMDKGTEKELAESTGEPKTELALEVGDIGLALNQSQYRALLAIGAGVSYSKGDAQVEEKEVFRTPTNEERDYYIGLYKRRFNGYKPLDDEAKQEIEVRCVCVYVLFLSAFFFFFAFLVSIPPIPRSLSLPRSLTLFPLSHSLLPPLTLTLTLKPPTEIGRSVLPTGCPSHAVVGDRNSGARARRRRY